MNTPENQGQEPVAQNPQVENVSETQPFDIDAIQPLSQVPVGQFDERGTIDVTKEKNDSAEAAVVLDETLKLSEKQREFLKKSAPVVYRLLNSIEKDTNTTPFGRASYEKSPLRAGSSAFGEDPYQLILTCMTQTGLRRFASSLLALDENDQRNIRWIEELNSALASITPEDHLLDALNRPESKWAQTIPSNDGRHIFGRSYEYKAPDKGTMRLSGPEAIGYAAAVAGAGRPSCFPMVSSGWSVWTRSGTNSEWARYYEGLVEARSELGRSTVGVGLACSRSMFIEQALLFTLDHVTGVSFQLGGSLEDRSSLLRYLKATDIDIFLTSFLVACHPDGFPVRIPCTNVGKCSHIEEMDANLRTMTVYDNSVFTEAQISHLLRTGIGDSSLESVLAYQEGLRTNQSRSYLLKKSTHNGEDIHIEFENCSAWDYIESSKRWIERVRLTLKGLVDANTSPTRRAELQNRFFWSAPMREYGHFVKSITIGNGVISANPDDKENPRADIEDFLVRASEDAVIREAFEKCAKDYMNRIQTSVLTIPKHTCSACGHGPVEEVTEGGRFSDCAPIDVGMTFFNLALRRLTELSR